jgi:HK97 gp10 family phage protein
MSRVEVHISGLDELQDKLNRLPVEFSRRALRTALRAPGLIFRDAIKSTAPVLTGWLKGHITVRAKTNNYDEGSVTTTFTRKAKPGDKTSAIYEALYAEFGTVKQSARPFIRPAFESSKQRALDAFIERLRETFSAVFHK